MSVRVKIGMLLFYAFVFRIAFAQYAIDWSTLDSGSGTSTGGVYSVSASLGQPDANAVKQTEGVYALDSGFWAVFAVQMPDAPYLSITPAGSGMALISWAPESSGWVLQQTDSLTNSWSSAPSMGTNNVTVPVTPPTRFYRLFKP